MPRKTKAKSSPVVDEAVVEDETPVVDEVVVEDETPVVDEVVVEAETPVVEKSQEGFEQWWETTARGMIRNGKSTNRILIAASNVNGTDLPAARAKFKSGMTLKDKARLAY